MKKWKHNITKLMRFSKISAKKKIYSSKCPPQAKAILRGRFIAINAYIKEKNI